MKKIYFTPGPTELYPEVKNYIARALNENVCSINHRSREYMDIHRSSTDALRQLLDIPEGFHVFFLSSATECMDRIIQNTVEESSFHFVNGAFAERFYRTALELNKKPAKAEAEYGSGFNFPDVRIGNAPELICFTQNETSTGVALMPEDIYEVKKEYPESLTAVDIVTSAPYVNIDYNKIDCAFFSVQKGFGLPAGLGVLIVNEKCIEKARYLKKKKIPAGSYHNFLSLHENALRHQTTETPNVLAIYLLGKVCRHLIDYGIDKIRYETEEKANLLYDFFDSHKTLASFVKDKASRSKTIINVETGNRQREIKDKLSEIGILVGSGYGSLKEHQIRIANFPMHRIEDVKRIISCLESI